MPLETASMNRLPRDIPIDSKHENENQRINAGTAPPDGCLLASRQLSVGRPDLSLRQSVAEASAHPRRCEAHAAGPLGHDARPELHLRPLEPGHKEIRR